MRSGIPALCVFLLFGALSSGRAYESKPEFSSRLDVCAANPPSDLGPRRDAQADAFVKAYLSSATHGGLYFAGEACSWSCSADAGVPGVPGTEDPRVACLANLSAVTRYSCSDPLRQLGLDVPDDQYFAETGAKFGGKFLQAPPELVAAAVGGATLDGLKQILDQHQWKYLEYDSTSVNNVPDGYRRILILVESDAYDQWVQITINRGPPERLARNIDFIAVEKKDEATGAALERPNLYFRGFSRGATSFVPEGHGTGHSLVRCYSCHGSGLRRVVPKPGSYDPASEGVVRYFRTKMDELTPAGFGPHYRPDEYGPTMGPEDAPDRLARISAGCAKILPAARRSAVAQAMSCASCHDGSYRGVLNAGTDSSTLRHKVVENTVAPMPPGSTLSPQERLVLYQCLREEYAGELQSWLKQQECPR